MEVSVSHAADLVVAACASSAVGVDVEQVRPVDRAELVGAVLGATECASLDQAPPEDRDLRFTRLWTRKEAVVKATGDGLRVPLSELTFEDSVTGPTLTGYPGRSELPARTSVIDLPTEDGHAAALAVIRIDTARYGPLRPTQRNGRALVRAFR